jgi:hypothetical protein
MLFRKNPDGSLAAVHPVAIRAERMESEWHPSPGVTVHHAVPRKRFSVQVVRKDEAITDGQLLVDRDRVDGQWSGGWTATLANGVMSSPGHWAVATESLRPGVYRCSQTHAPDGSRPPRREQQRRSIESGGIVLAPVKALAEVAG